MLSCSHVKKALLVNQENKIHSFASRFNKKYPAVFFHFVAQMVNQTPLEVYTYSMMIWPWLVLTSVVSRLFIERQVRRGGGRVGDCGGLVGCVFFLPKCSM